MSRSCTTMGIFLAAGLLLALAAPARAHDTWLLQDHGEPSLYFLSSSMQFPAPDTAIQPERIARAGCISAVACSLTVDGPGEHALRLRASGGKGTALYWVELAPRPIELNPREVAEYLDEIAAPARVRKAWEQMPAPKRWRESYVKFAKAIDGVARASAAVPGAPLELVVTGELYAGRRIGVRVLKHGKPLRGLAVILSGPGAPDAKVELSDARGEVSFAIPAAGPWLLKATELTRVHEPGLEWRSWFTTVTFQAQ